MTDKKVMAQVNGVDVTIDDVMKVIQGMGQQGGQFLSQEGIETIANEIINQELLYQDALNNNLEEDDEFKLRLEEDKRNLLKNYAMYKLFEDIDITEEDVKKYYEDNQEIIKPAYEYDADHILVKTEEEANKIYGEVNDGNFSDLARDNSTCPSKEKGGNLGKFRSGDMVKEFDLALESMEEGEISKPVKSQFGFHIIRLNEKKLVEKPSFENMKDQLKHQLLMMRQQDLYTKKVKELEGNFEVKRFF